MRTIEAEVVKQIEEAAAKVRETNPTLTRAQAFTRVLNARTDLHRQLAEARVLDRQLNHVFTQQLRQLQGGRS